MTLLQINAISKSYHAPVLNEVTLTINQGELVCLLGKSGSGKSTLLNIIAGIEKQDKGTITCIEKIAYMQQKDLLLPFKTVLDNVLLPQKIQGTLTKAFQQEAIQFLDKLGLKDTCFQYPDELSGGMKQRVAFARTILSNDKLILLDEPFSALDFMTRTSLQKWYADLSQEYQLTTLLVTHDIDEALLLADKIVILDNGRLHQFKSLSKPKENYIFTQHCLSDKQELLSLLI